MSDRRERTSRKRSREYRREDSRERKRRRYDEPREREHRREDRDRRSRRDSREQEYRESREERRERRGDKDTPKEVKPASSVNISDIGAKLAAAKAAMEEKKKSMLQKTAVEEKPKAPTTSKEAQEALRRAKEKIGSKIHLPPSIPVLGSDKDKLLALQTVQIKDSLINRRIGRQQLEQDNVTANLVPESDRFFDPRLDRKKMPQRERKSFKFVEPGSYVRQGQSMRAEKFTNQQGFNESDPLNQRLFFQLKREPVPAVEWWDRHLVRNVDTYDLENVVVDHLTLYVQHPVPEKQPASEKNVGSTSFLTKKEKKKLHRIHREEVQKEKQIKIMLGIEKPPEARATLSNMNKVYGAKAFEDPTKIEQLVRQQMQEREDKHNRMNQERKLTPEQRKQKKLEKLRKNETGEICVVVFKVHDISYPLHRKNIEHTTKDGALSGVLLICAEGECNLIIAEGGPRAIKKFKRLMTARLKWEDSKPGNRCDLIWEGVLQRRQFKKFRFHDCATKAEAREVLAPKNLAHYWDTADNLSDDIAD